MRILDFASAVNDYLSGTQYGQCGLGPKGSDYGLSQIASEDITSAVSFGRNAALALNENDVAKADYYVDCFSRLAIRTERLTKISIREMNLAYIIGYNKLRK